MLRALVGRDRTLLVATHDEEFARSVATRVLHLATACALGRLAVADRFLRVSCPGASVGLFGEAA